MISTPRGTVIGYLPQEVLGLGGRTVLAEALAAFEHLHGIAAECERLEAELADSRADDPDHEDLMTRYALAREAWDTHGSYDLESRAEQILAGLGFKSTDLTRDCSEFSGGWQMRIALAQLLLRQPQLLLLDEPTNHLDLEARDWLEDFLKNYPHTVILVAHDRYFLDQAVKRITEISRGRLSDFNCNYTRYLIEKVDREQQQEAAYKQQQEEIERIEAFISRFRYQASKAALVQSRIKQLEKIERIDPPEGMRTVHFRFPQPPRSGRTVLELQGVSKRYEALQIYEGLDLSIERGRKIALVGPNGAGKSTLMRLLAGVDMPDTGERRVGHNVAISYFAQDRGASLAPEKSVLEVVTDAAPLDLVPSVRGLLGAFLFSGDSVYKKTKVLSGGEKSRLALATLLLHPTNFLLLDEPTNHLDLAAKEVLLEALQNFTGTLIFVAHDRYFLDHLPDEVIEVGNGRADRYLGHYEDYLRKKASLGDPAVAVPAATAPSRSSAPPVAPTRLSDAERAEKRRLEREAARRAQEASKLEALIAEKEASLSALSATINEADFYVTHANPQLVFSDFAQLKKDIDGLYAKLERLSS